MLRRSFVPPQPVRDLRALTRARLAQDRAPHQARVETILEDALLTELRGEIPEFKRRARAFVATFPAHDQRRRCVAGPVVVGSATARVV